jgi:hypothetical protein
MAEAAPLNREAHNNRGGIFVAARLRECRIEALAHEKRLRQVNYNLLTKGMPTLVASLAGVSLFAEDSYKALDIATAIAALLTAMHAAAGCDDYQAELREKRQMYNYLARRYEAFRHGVYLADQEQEMEKLELDFQNAAKTGTIDLRHTSAWNKAEAEIDKMSQEIGPSAPL